MGVSVGECVCVCVCVCVYVCVCGVWGCGVWGVWVGCVITVLIYVYIHGTKYLRRHSRLPWEHCLYV